MPLIWRHGTDTLRPKGLVLLRALPLLRRPRPQSRDDASRRGSAGEEARNLYTPHCSRGRRR
ncbi:hypothetical protein [Streptomyces poriticola]|uniref:hypothetical protein n=1 Tax=Streptomyces poriticola TaxID=3120506 RepID=UPI002FCE62FD